MNDVLPKGRCRGLIDRFAANTGLNLLGGLSGYGLMRLCENALTFCVTGFSLIGQVEEAG